MPKRDSDASALASLPDGSKAGELIPELARHGLQQLIELEVAAVLGADLLLLLLLQALLSLALKAPRDPGETAEQTLR
jgi:hypothetical protein